MSECQTCDGTGQVDCETCDSDNEVSCEECSSGQVSCVCDCGDEHTTECGDCDGRGYIACHECDGNGTQECGDCYGTGEVNDSPTCDCPSCRSDRDKYPRGYDGTKPYGTLISGKPIPAPARKRGAAPMVTEIRVTPDTAEALAALQRHLAGEDGRPDNRQVDGLRVTQCRSSYNGYVCLAAKDHRGCCVGWYSGGGHSPDAVWPNPRGEVGQLCAHNRPRR